MGGAWSFSIKGDVATSTTFNLNSYHRALRDIRKKVEGQSLMFESAAWVSSEQQAQRSNVYAVFTTSCNRHEWHKSASYDGGSKWKLYWDPLKVPIEERTINMHGKCTGLSFDQRKGRYEIQRELERLFPSVFEIVLGDDESADGDDKSDDGKSGAGKSGNGKSGAGKSSNDDVIFSYGDSLLGDDDDYRDDCYGYGDGPFTPYTGYYTTGNGDRAFMCAGEAPNRIFNPVQS